MILLKNCLYISTSLDKEGIKGSDILIEGNKIKSIAKEINASELKGNDVRIIDCTHNVVVPGFVNTHHHFFQTLTRNLPAVQNAKLFDWLIYLYEIWKNLDEDAVFYSSLVAMGELLKTGCTSSTDHHYLYPGGFKGDLMGTSSKLPISWEFAFLRPAVPCPSAKRMEVYLRILLYKAKMKYLKTASE